MQRSGFLLLLYMYLIYSSVFYIINRYDNNESDSRKYFYIFMTGLFNIIIDSITHFNKNAIDLILLGTSYMVLAFFIGNLYHQWTDRLPMRKLILGLFGLLVLNISIYYASDLISLSPMRTINIVPPLFVLLSILLLLKSNINDLRKKKYRVLKLIEFETYLALLVINIIAVVNQVLRLFDANLLLNLRYLYTAYTFVIFQLGILWITKVAITIIAKLNIERYVDPLTGMRNRRYFFEKVDQPEVNVYGFIILDIDNFKSINDEYGHSFGDQVLVHISKHFKSTEEDKVLTARIGGEEFAIATFDSSLPLYDHIERLRKAIENDWIGGIQVTVSCGMVTNRQLDLSINDLYLKADQCLYEAKSRGKNQTVSLNNVK